VLKQFNIFGVGVKTKDLYQTAIGVSTTYRERGEGGGGDFIFGTRVMGNIFVAGQIQKRRIILKKK
jgi:hypothetical protein